MDTEPHTPQLFRQPLLQILVGLCVPGVFHRISHNPRHFIKLSRHRRTVFLQSRIPEQLHFLHLIQPFLLRDGLRHPAWRACEAYRQVVKGLPVFRKPLLYRMGLLLPLRGKGFQNPHQNPAADHRKRTYQKSLGRSQKDGVISIHLKHSYANLHRCHAAARHDSVKPAVIFLSFHVLVPPRLPCVSV